MCPYCYNHPPFAGMVPGTGCNGCKHPDCQHSLATLGVSSCDDCESGILVLDPASAPNWKLACNNNKCSTVVMLFQHAHRVSLFICLLIFQNCFVSCQIVVSEDLCEFCDRFIIDVDFHKEKSPFEDGRIKHSGLSRHLNLIYDQNLFQDAFLVMIPFLN